MTVSRSLLVALALSVSFPALGQQRTHRLKAAPDTVVWGYYDASVAPVLTVDSGDIVEVETMVTGARLSRVLGVPEEVVLATLKKLQGKGIIRFSGNSVQVPGVIQ